MALQPSPSSKYSRHPSDFDIIDNLYLVDPYATNNMIYLSIVNNLNKFLVHFLAAVVLTLLTVIQMKVLLVCPRRPRSTPWVAPQRQNSLSIFHQRVLEAMSFRTTLHILYTQTTMTLQWQVVPTEAPKCTTSEMSMTLLFADKTHPSKRKPDATLSCLT